MKTDTPPFVLADTSEGLEAQRAQIEEQLASIKGQIDTEVAKYRDGHAVRSNAWLASARSAQRHKGVLHQKVLRAIKAKRLEKQFKARPIAEQFIDVARKRLPPSTFEEILAEATARSQPHEALPDLRPEPSGSKADSPA